MVTYMTEAFLFLHPISSLPGFHAHWIPRLNGINVLGDRDFAIRNLAPRHDSIIAAEYHGIATRNHAEQVHGNSIALITSPCDEEIITHPAVDGLVTNLRGQLLAIYIADCAAIYLADPVTRAIALLHSGKKGTAGNILDQAVSIMVSTYGSHPSNLVCVVSPCIRPPDYEIDIATTIANQARDLGIQNFYDSCENTAADLARHYSYRIEKGQTGRMLALLSIC